MADLLLWRSQLLQALRPFCVFQPTCDVAKILSVSVKTEIWNSCEYQFNAKIRKLWKTWIYKNLTIKNSKSRNYTKSHKISGKAVHHFTASQLHRQSRNSLILLQHAASQQCLSKTSNTFFLSEKEKIFNTKAMVTRKRSASVVKKLTNYEHLALSKTKKQPQVASGLH